MTRPPFTRGPKIFALNLWAGLQTMCATMRNCCNLMEVQSFANCDRAGDPGRAIAWRAKEMHGLTDPFIPFLPMHTKAGFNAQIESPLCPWKRGVDL